MKIYTQQEKDFRLELSNLLNKFNASLCIEDTEDLDYTNIPNFGDIFKNTIQVQLQIPTDGGVFKPQVCFDLGSYVSAENVFSSHNKIVLPDLAD